MGIDGASEMLQRCEAQRQELQGGQRAFRAGPLTARTGRRSADLLISSSVVEYVDDLGRMLAQFRRLVKPGGASILSLLNLASLSGNFQRVQLRLTAEPEIYRHIKHYSLLRLRLKQYRLILAEARYYTHATRLEGRLINAQPHPY
jgi:2-polyprenyl-3-methyl-5-hydroxy-6-metoxy-1,4-benzoquinol methylase